MEKLLIKCPSCAIVLEVSNTKNEAVKRITCPNCKKQLAVTFKTAQDKPSQPQQPFGTLYCGATPLTLHEGINQIPLQGDSHLEVEAVRLADGSSKCIVKAQAGGQQLVVNGHPLTTGDKIVLAVGDEVQVGDTRLTFGVRGKEPEAPCQPTQLKAPQKPATKQPKLKRPLPKWPLAAAVFMLMLGLTVWMLWPSADKQVGKPAQPVEVSEEKPAKSQPKPKQQKDRKEPKAPADQPQPESLKAMSDYELAQEARHDAEAQYELGKRKIARKDSIDIVIGVNYLKLAARNGSSDAEAALHKVYGSLERDAANGSSLARNLLDVIK